MRVAKKTLEFWLVTVISTKNAYFFVAKYRTGQYLTVDGTAQFSRTLRKREPRKTTFQR